MALWKRRRDTPRPELSAAHSDGGAGLAAVLRGTEVPVPTVSGLPRVTRSRIAQWCTENEYHFFMDSDGDLGGLWHSRMFFFFLLGQEEEILQIRSQWNRRFTIELLDEVLTFCNEWNTQRVWPKTYVRVHDDGAVQVCAEHSVDFEDGAEDDQLALQLVCGLSTQTHFWDALDEAYPDPAQVAS